MEILDSKFKKMRSMNTHTSSGADTKDWSCFCKEFRNIVLFSSWFLRQLEINVKNVFCELVDNLKKKLITLLFILLFLLFVSLT